MCPLPSTTMHFLNIVCGESNILYLINLFKNTQKSSGNNPDEIIIGNPVPIPLESHYPPHKAKYITIPVEVIGVQINEADDILDYQIPSLIQI